MKKPMLLIMLGFIAGVLITIFLTSSAVNTSNRVMMRMMGVQTAKLPYNILSSKAIDAHFIEQMIPHHEDAITMAILAQTKSQRSEVKQLAQNIIDSQSKEISQMQVWYRDWFGKEVPKDSRVMGEHGMGQSTRMHMGMMGDETDIQRLEKAIDFDQVFIEEMIPHHQMAVMMATMLKNSTGRPEMSKLADDIIAAQTNEIELMRSWVNEWK